MTITLEELIYPPELSSVENDTTSVLAAVGCPITAWQATGTGASIINASANLWHSVLTRAADIAKFNLIRYSTGDLCTAAAYQRYGLTRNSARQTIGSVTVYATGVGATFAAGEFVVTSGDFTYTNTSSVTIDSTGLSVEIIANLPGESYNRTGESLVAPSGYTLVAQNAYGWITELGLNEESDERLILRCTTQSLARSPAGPWEFYAYHALQTDPSITRVRVLTKLYDIDGYHVQVRLGTDFGAATVEQVLAVDAVYQDLKPNGTLVNTTYATEATITLNGTVWGSTSQDVDGRLRALVRAHNPSEPLYDDEIIRAIGGNRQAVTYEEGNRALTSGQSIAPKDVFSIVNNLTVNP